MWKWMHLVNASVFYILCIEADQWLAAMFHLVLILSSTYVYSVVLKWHVSEMQLATCNVYITIAVLSSRDLAQRILIKLCSLSTSVCPACCIILISILLVVTVLSCGTPSSLSNGQRHYSNTTVGSTVTYTCNTGYRMTAGNSSRTCLFGGRWSGSHPTCSSEFTLVTFIIFAAWLSWG